MSTAMMRLADPAPYPDYDGTQHCAGEDPELFFPRTSRDTYFSEPRIAACCSACPFLTPCLEFAVTHNVFGYWGGKSPDQRADIRRQRGITPRSLI